MVCSKTDANNSGSNWQRQMLLCDRCKKGAHRECLSTRSVLPMPGEWLCPRCRKSGDAVEVAIRNHRRLARLTSPTELVYDDEPNVTHPANLDEVRWRWLGATSDSATPGSATPGSATPGSATLAGRVEAIVLDTFCRNPEFVWARLDPDVSYSAVCAAIVDLPLVRSVRRVLVHRRGPSLAGELRRMQRAGDDAGAAGAAAVLALLKQPVYSNIVAGRFTREQNYACRLLQMDLMVVPNVEIKNNKFVRSETHPNVWVLTCICVGSRRAWCRVVGVGRGSHPVHARTATVVSDLFETEIVPRYVRRVHDEEQAERDGYYTEASYRARARQRLAERAAVAARRERRVTRESLGHAPVLRGGPDAFESGAYDASANHALSKRPLIRHLGAGTDDRERNWLCGLRELTMAADGRREVERPWERTAPSLIIMTDAGDFGAVARGGTIEALVATQLGATAATAHVRWCVVNKSQLHRKSLHIIERFHRTVRGALSICFAAHGPVAGAAYVAPTRSLRLVLEQVIPDAYNAVRHSTTRHTPDALWDPQNYLSLCSAETPRFGSLDAFRIGTRVEVMHGKTGGEISNRQVVKRFGGLTVVYLNHCTLELRSDTPEDNVEIDHPVARSVWKFSPVPAWMCSIVGGGKRTLATQLRDADSEMAADTHLLESDPRSVIIPVATRMRV